MTSTEIALAAFASLITDFDQEAARNLFAPDIIQHNPGVPTGAEPLIGFIPALEDSGIAVTTHRVLTDGDYVVLHSTVENAQLFGAPTMVAFDVYRIEDGKVAEHWDNLQALEGPNASGHTMTDGPTEVTDLDRTDANKALVAEFAQTVLIEGDFGRISDYFTPDLIQHNPWWGDGLTALGEGFASYAEQGKALQYTKIHQIIGEGDFVLMMAEGTLGETPTAYYDLLRLEDGLVVEHWDVIAEIPAEMAHGNGMF